MEKKVIESIKTLRCNSRDEYMVELAKVFEVSINLERASCISSIRGMSHNHKVLGDNKVKVEFKTKKNELVEVELITFVGPEKYDYKYETICKRRGKWYYRDLNRETREWIYTLA